MVFNQALKNAKLDYDNMVKSLPDHMQNNPMRVAMNTVLARSLAETNTSQ